MFVNMAEHMLHEQLKGCHMPLVSVSYHEVANAPSTHNSEEA